MDSLKLKSNGTKVVTLVNLQKNNELTKIVKYIEWLVT